MTGINLPDWDGAFDSICRNATHQLEWGMPEPWVQTQMYAWFKQSASESGWYPFDTEVPYLTYYPVILPRARNRNWTHDGAIKWIDLCLRHESGIAWCWFELKVRHASTGARSEYGTRAALDATVKDYVGLCGIDPAVTANVWTHPDETVRAYWFAEILGPRAGELVRANHYIFSAFLQLNGAFDSTIISEITVRNRLIASLESRSRESTHKREFPDTHVKIASSLPGGHALLLCSARLGNERSVIAG